MPKLSRGILCAIEGIDGSGKTLLASNIYTALLLEKFPVLLTKEPGGSSLGAYLREILQKQPVPISAQAEYLLYAADRAQHFDEVIIPALKKNMLILSDRLDDSSLVYQGYGRGLSLEMICKINQWAMKNIKPDLILYVKIDASTAQKRLVQRGKVSVFDQKSIKFFTTLSNKFDTLYAKRNNVMFLDGTRSPEALQQQALTGILQWIHQQNLIL